MKQLRFQKKFCRKKNMCKTYTIGGPDSTTLRSLMLIQKMYPYIHHFPLQLDDETKKRKCSISTPFRKNYQAKLSNGKIYSKQKMHKYHEKKIRLNASYKRASYTKRITQLPFHKWHNIE